MDVSGIRAEARAYFVPFLLGSNSTAHSLSRRIYQKYKITCYILDKKRSLNDFLSLSSRFIMLDNAKSDITAMQLRYLAEQSEYTLPLLIPCSEEYSALVGEHRTLLEETFIISSAEDALKQSPLAKIP